MKLDTNILIYIAIVIILGAVSIITKNKRMYVFKIITRFILGAVFIYLFNLLGGFIGVNIPLNPITALLTGLLEVPGFVLIFIIKYAIFPSSL